MLSSKQKINDEEPDKKDPIQIQGKKFPSEFYIYQIKSLTLWSLLRMGFNCFKAKEPLRGGNPLIKHQTLPSSKKFVNPLLSNHYFFNSIFSFSFNLKGKEK